MSLFDLLDLFGSKGSSKTSFKEVLYAAACIILIPAAFAIILGILLNIIGC